MSGRAEIFLIEPPKWSFEAEEVTVDEARLQALLDGPDPGQPDNEIVLALMELLHAEVAELSAADCGFLNSAQLTLAFDALFTTVRRMGLTEEPSEPSVDK